MVWAIIGTALVCFAAGFVLGYRQAGIDERYIAEDVDYWCYNGFGKDG